MKYILNFMLITTMFSATLRAQNTITNISNITPLSRQEFEQLKNVRAGDIVLVKDEGLVYYYSGKQWLALMGECFPRPVSPNIDSVKLISGKLHVYFNDEKKDVQTFIVSTDKSDKELSASNSPAVFDKPTSEGMYNFTVKGKNECGTSGPVSSFLFEYKEK